MKKREEEMMKKFKEMQNNQEEKENLMKENEQQLKEHNDKLIMMNSDLENEKIKQINKLNEIEVVRKKKFGEKIDLERSITKYLTMVKEANLLANKLKINVLMHLKMASNAWEFDNSDELYELENEKVEIIIEVFNMETYSIIEWSLDEFEERLFALRNMLNKFESSNKIQELKNEEDPFWDPTSHILIGKVSVQLKNLM